MQDWIKMRTDLYRDPKVSIMANHLLSKDGALAAHVSQNLQCDMAVTRNVMRCATVGATLATWGVMRHRGKRNGDDLECHNVSIEVIDDISDLPGFGEAMEACGWVVAIEGGICFPRFFAEYNVQIDNKGKSSAAERQRNYRQRQKDKRNGERCATGDVTRNGREEESREEEIVDISGGDAVAEQRKQPLTHGEMISAIESAIPAAPDPAGDPEAVRCLEQWQKHIDDKAPDKAFHQGTQQHREIVELLRALGAKEFCERVKVAIRNGWLNLHEPPKRGSGGGKSGSKPKGPTLEFLRAVNVCREYPSASDYDREKRETLLGPDLMRTVRKMGTPRLAECDRYTQSALAAEWEILRESTQ